MKALKEILKNRITLVIPSEKHIDKIQEYKNEFVNAGETYLPGTSDLLKTESISEWIEKVNKNSKTIGLTEEGHVPSTIYLAVESEAGKIIGIMNIRHELNDYLFNFGGHIGYCVSPTERKKGYAKEMLALSLEKCKELGIDKVLVTCRDTNEASRKTIIACGGIYENEIIGVEDAEMHQRFWIEL